jgi:hypothetical protein
MDMAHSPSTGACAGAWHEIAQCAPHTRTNGEKLTPFISMSIQEFEKLTETLVFRWRRRMHGGRPPKPFPNGSVRSIEAKRERDQRLHSSINALPPSIPRTMDMAHSPSTRARWSMARDGSRRASARPCPHGSGRCALQRSRRRENLSARWCCEHGVNPKNNANQA